MDSSWSSGEDQSTKNDAEMAGEDCDLNSQDEVSFKVVTAAGCGGNAAAPAARGDGVKFISLNNSEMMSEIDKSLVLPVRYNN